MNRAQRRKQIRGLNEFQPPKAPVRGVMPPRAVQNAELDFSDVPLATVCQSIRLLINELRNRGYPVYDFDRKEKSVQSIQIIRNKVYFMAAEEAVTDGKAQAGSEDNGKQAHG